MTAVFLQVRLDSSRLPGKALADLGGEAVTTRCLRALNEVDADKRVLVTEPGSVGPLRPLAEAQGWSVFVGSKDNVLDRFVQAARSVRADTLVRATGDNPLVSAALANRLLGLFREAGADYGALEGAPVGTGVEVLRVAALETALDSGPDAYEREHVSPYLYRRPEQFRIARYPVEAALQLPDARVTIDTAADLESVRALWASVFRGHPPTVQELIPWLKANPR